MTDLFIAGHGKNRNGSFDSGATGFISKGRLYKVQVGSFNKLDNAKRLRNELIKKGYKDT